MPISSKSLQEHIERRDLVSIHRAIPDSHSIQGFVLACSKNLILLQYVYDFRLDGFRLLRRRDITELKAGDTDCFQRQLLVADGVLEQVDFGFRTPIQSYDSFLASLSSDEIVIVEAEASEPTEFLIGSVSHVDRRTATIRHFSGVARFFEPPISIPTAQITDCQIRNSYTSSYQRHFERIKQSQ